SVFYSDPVEKEVKPLYSTFVKAGEMHTVPPPITGTYMPSPYQSDIEETQTQTKDIPPAVDIQTLPESVVEDPNSTTGSPSFSCSENVKSPRIIYTVPCKSKAASVPAGSRDSSAFVTAGGTDYFRPSSVYFNNMYWPEFYDPMFMYKGRWDTAVKTSAVDMVLNPPWNLPFLGAKGLTSPEQTATVKMVFSQPWTCIFLVAKGLTTPELMANCQYSCLSVADISVADEL
ncbi:hypothetical protein Tco_1085747, partial [Tanacetum coccineum]